MCTGLLKRCLINRGDRILFKQLKQYLYKKYPEFSAASSSYGMAREMRKSGFKETPFGFRLSGPTAMQEGTFEPDETRCVQKFLHEKTDVFVDVGANVGYFTCMARSMNKYTIAVEPLLQNLNYLYANLEINGWKDVEVFPVGLSDHSGMAVLYGPGTAASLIQDWAGISTKKCVIPLSTLDTIVGSRFRGRQMLIKIDVEGTELDVLKGATETIASQPSPVWLVENGVAGFHPAGYNPCFRQVFDFFWSHGYQAMTMGGKSRTVTDADVDSWITDKKTDAGSNFLFEKR
jgi:FkbM family methyltransferase